MTRLLNILHSRGTPGSYLKQLLAASPNRGPARPAAARASMPLLIEPLTNRELQVLERLALRLTDKEIAQALVISPLTVKAHTDHIYQKLGVNNRQEAVKVGVAFGILDRAISAQSGF